jgi:hypothetical protein
MGGRPKAWQDDHTSKAEKRTGEKGGIEVAKLLEFFIIVGVVLTGICLCLVVYHVRAR